MVIHGRTTDGKFASKQKVEKGGVVDEKNEVVYVEDESLKVKLLKKTIDQLKKKLEGITTGESLIMDAVEEAFDEPVDLTIPKMPPKSRKKHEETAVLHLCDVHIGKVTESYDSGVAELRLLTLAAKVIEITETRRTSAKIDKLKLYLGGDMIEGEEIFPTQVHMIDQSLFDQAVKHGPSILARVILKLLESFREIDIITVPGNHGRNGSKGTRSHPRTNWDNICYEVTKLMLLGPDHDRKELVDRLSFRISDSFYIVDNVYEWGNLLVHGHEIRGGFAGFPWYGAAKKAWGWIDSIPEPWDYLWFGHFHTYASATLNHRYFLCNGSTESDNDFAQANMSACGHPCQRLCFFNASSGLISDNQVFLADRMPNKFKYVNPPS
jgi:hypothetical protein